MISGWDNLIDRCLLYAEAPRQMIKNLLMEAEDELSREVDIAERMIRAVTPLNYYGTGTSLRENPLALPNDYKKMKEVRYKGEILPLIDRDFIDLDTNNTLKSGTPTGYFIGPNQYGDTAPAVWLDKNPPNGDYLTVIYYAQLSRLEEGNFSVPFLGGTDSTTPGVVNDGNIFLATDLGSVLNGAIVNLGGIGNITLTYNSIYTNYLSNNPNSTTEIPTSTLAHKYGGVWSWYNHKSDLSGREAEAKVVSVNDYRKYSPIVPQMYRISLCNYAIALSQAKANPELHDKHYQMWLQDVEKIKNEQADKSLNHTIKEVI